MPRGGFGMRRRGSPLMMGGLGGMGMGMGMGSPLMTGIMASGLGYMLGSNHNQNPMQQPAQYYPAAPAAMPTRGTGGDGGTLAQRKLLGQVHDSGTLTDAEFATEKQKILGSA